MHCGLRCEVATEKQLTAALQLPFEYVYAPVNSSDERVIYIPPLFGYDCDKFLNKRVLCRSIGQVEYFSQKERILHGGMSLNITNDRAAEFYAEKDVSDIILPLYELGTAKAQKLSSPVPKGVIAYGRYPLMQLRHNKTEGAKYLTDRKNMKFPLVRDRCGTTEVENAVITKFAGYEDFDFAVLRFTPYENEKNIEGIYYEYKNKKTFPRCTAPLSGNRGQRRR
jgi:hypothetical protein